MARKAYSVKMKTPLLYHGDCREVLCSILDNSIDLIATDPPYFLDGMDDEWNHNLLKYRQVSKSSQTSSISGLPASMKFDPDQGKRLQKFMESVSKELIRVIKPGGYFVAFAHPRLYHRLAVAIEDVGFEVRDMLIWEHQGGQGKAFKMDHVVNGMKELDIDQKSSLITGMEGRKTPQVRPKHEPFVLAQKPKDGNFVQNWMRWNTGLAKMEFNGRQQCTVFQFDKPNLREKHDHMTIKPQGLMERIIEMFSLKGQVVLDPFMGSGTTGSAAKHTGRLFVGIEKEEGSFKLALERIGG